MVCPLEYISFLARIIRNQSVALALKRSFSISSWIAWGRGQRHRTGDHKGPPITLPPRSPLLYTGLASRFAVKYSRGRGGCGRGDGALVAIRSHLCQKRWKSRQ